jgi:hypothetical protein
VVEETVKEMLPINQILKTYLNKNAVDVMNGENIEPEAEPETMEEETDMFPGGGEIPVENESYEEPEPEPEQEPVPEMESEEPEMELPQETETKSFTFRDNIARRAPIPSPNEEEEEDFSINPSANR